MNKPCIILGTMLVCFSCVSAWAASEVAPSVPNLSLPTEEEVSVERAGKQDDSNREVGFVSGEPSVALDAKPAQNAGSHVKITNGKVNSKGEIVEQIRPNKNLLPKELREPVKQPEPEVAPIKQPERKPVVDNVDAGALVKPDFVPVREEGTKTAAKKPLKVSYNPRSKRDPMLSPDDALLLKHREEERLRAIEAEKQRKIEEERKRLAELERQRQLELERLRDPSREIRGKIRVNGIIGQEAFIGSKVYGIGGTVLGAKIIAIQPDAVVFMYKGQRFTKKVQLQ